jgi:TrmH family RNA methyltransferase
VPVYGTFLDGNDIYDEKLEQRGIIVMGNEGRGVSEEIEKMVTSRLYVPNYPSDRETGESLNVAIATAIVCSEFRRRAR